MVQRKVNVPFLRVRLSLDQSTYFAKKRKKGKERKTKDFSSLRYKNAHFALHRVTMKISGVTRLYN